MQNAMKTGANPNKKAQVIKFTPVPSKIINSALQTLSEISQSSHQNIHHQPM